MRQQHDRQIRFGEPFPEPLDRQAPHGVEPGPHGPPVSVEHYAPRNESPSQRTEEASEIENRKQVTNR